MATVRLAFLCALASLCLIHSDIALAKPTESSDRWYEVHAKGKQLGYLNLKESWDSSNGIRAKCIESELFLKIKYLIFFTLKLRKTDKILLDPRHGLLETSSIVEANGKQGLKVAGRPEGDEFHKGFETSKGIQNKACKLDSFDCTELDIPYSALEYQRPRTIRIMGLGSGGENNGIIEFTCNWIRNQNTLIEGHSISCKVIEFESKVNSGQRWVIPDSSGMLVYEEGKLGKWPYKVMLTSKEKALDF